MTDLRVVDRGSEGYPALLAEIPDPPERLWVVGRALDDLPPCVAIVGTRSPTPYGREVARDLARDLASAGTCVVSGMARGIDSEAHEGALAAGGTTIAVLAAGAERAYPPGNARLYAEILDGGGAVVSERPPGTRVHRKMFVERNRIISGLALVTVVVQGVAFRSGALATARFAGDQGREVFAVPGDVRSDRSGGPHSLLRDGAHVCEGAGDVLGELDRALGRSGVEVPERIPPRLDPEAAAVLASVTAEPARAEAVAARSGLDAAAAARALTSLELDGVVRRGPDGTYFRAR